MERDDARKLSPEAQHKRRNQVVRAFKRGGVNRRQIARDLGLSPARHVAKREWRTDRSLLPAQLLAGIDPDERLNVDLMSCAEMEKGLSGIS